MIIKDKWKSDALVDKNKYQEMYDESINHNEKFWEKQGLRLSWKKKYTKIRKVKYSSKEVNINWYYVSDTDLCSKFYRKSYLNEFN